MSLDANAALASSDGPLTIDQAVDLQLARTSPGKPEPEQAEPADSEAVVEDEQQESQVEPQPAEEVEGEAQEPNAEDDEAGEVEPDLPAIDPPQFWDATGKEEFAKLSREAQQAVVAYEKQRTAAVARAMEQSTQARKAAEAKQQQLQQVVESLSEYADQTEQNLAAWSEWFSSDEAARLAATDPRAFAVEQVKHQRAVREHEKAKADKAKADSTLLKTHVAEQSRLMTEIVPALFDPKEGKKRREDMVAYLKNGGFTEDRIQWITAQEASIAYKAMRFDSVPDFDEVVRKAALYDKADAVRKTPPANPKPKPKAGPSATPAGQGQRPSSSEAQFQKLSSKASLSADEHTELMLLKSKLRK